MITTFKHPQDEIDAAMKMHRETLHDAFFDFIVALITILLGITSGLHAIGRMIYAINGLMVWMLGVWIWALQAWREKYIQKSSTSPFRPREVRNE